MGSPTGMFFLKILNSTRYAIVLGAPPRGTRQKRRGTRYTASPLEGLGLMILDKTIENH